MNNINYYGLDALEKYNIDIKDKIKEVKKGNLSSFQYRLLRRIRKIIYGKKRIDKLHNSHPLINLEEADRIKALFYEGDKKIAIYTCITNGYESINEPIFVNDNVDYYIFSDKEVECEVWKYKRIPEKLKDLSPADKNRYIKMHPQEFFGGYDYAIYVDGSIKIISDLAGIINLLNTNIGLAFHSHVERDCIYKEAEICKLFKKGNYRAIENTVSSYKTKLFPAEYGMLECGIIAISLNNNLAKKILEQWWEEYTSSMCGRDQIILPYVLWKNGIMPVEINTLGKNLYKNSKILYIPH